MKFQVLGLLLWSVFFQCDYTFAQYSQPLQHLWEVQPDLGDIWNRANQPTRLLFDIELLDSSEIQDQVHAAQLICNSYESKAFTPPVRDRAIELLVAKLEKGNMPLQVHRSMVSALALISDGSHAKMLWDVSQRDPLARSRVERSLVQWKSLVAIESWRGRLKVTDARPVDIALALEGLAAVGDPKDNNALEEVLRGNRTTQSNRHLAANAMGQLNQKGLEELAKSVLASNVEHRYLLAAHLIKRHTSESALEYMRVIYEEGPPVAQRIAAHSICVLFPMTAVEFAPRFLTHDDPEVRLSALAFLQSQTDETSLKLQGSLLRDRNSDVRQLVGNQLTAKAKAGQKAIVDECITEQLNGELWPGIEQAILVAVRLKDTSRCRKFVELLSHPQAEVNMFAGWALMELAEEPEILEEVYAHAQKATEFLSIRGPDGKYKDTDLIRISYLHEALGRKRYEPAIGMLLKYVPKNDFKLGIVSRASAIWALGQLLDDKDDPALRARLMERMRDLAPVLPEDYLVRFSCALALGEMGFEDSIATLEEFNDGSLSELGHACTWALGKIRSATADRK